MAEWHCIDRAWCDLHGVYLAGWAHRGAEAFDTVTLCCAGHRQTAELLYRPDIQAAFPDVPAGQKTGFTTYLACPPFRPVTLELRRGEQMVEIAVNIDAGSGPKSDPELDRPVPMDVFVAGMRARHGTVLEIGARVVGVHSSLNAAQFQPECRFIGCDIHPAPGVDLVADAHFLSRSVAPGSVDGVFSLAVLEHLAAPWMVAAEINRVLRLGGETLHVVPQAWPVHEQPNDFWRMSDEALRVLFGPATGFEVLEASMACPVQIVPQPSFRHGGYLEIPMSFSYAAAFIWARKVAELEQGAVQWPMLHAESKAISQAYPMSTPGARGIGPQK